MSGSLCSESAAMTIVPWAVLGFYAVLFVVILVMRRVFAWRQTAKRRGNPLVGMVIGCFFVMGTFLYIRSKDNDGFLEFHTDPSAVTLSYFWPKSKAVVPLSSITEIVVLRGRHFYKSKRSDDRAWLKIKAGSSTYSSCETAKIADMTAAGRSLATATGKPLAWQERCPDPDNRAVPATEAQVTGPGRMDVPPACSARP